MAEHLKAKQIKQLPVEEYTRLRPQLRSGDLFFASGSYPLSRAIRKLTDSEWSHVAIVLRLESLARVLLLESIEDTGVRFAPLSRYLKDYRNGKPYRGPIVLARHAGVTEAGARAMAHFGLDELTRPFDKYEMGKIVARIALGQGKLERDREYLCSELVWECFAHAGIEIEHDPRGFVSPENMWRCPEVQLLARIL